MKGKGSRLSCEIQNPGASVIELSRLNGKKFVLNCELIKTIEATPDTVISLTSGEKLMVREPVADVMSKTMDYLKRLRQEPPGAAVAAADTLKKT